MGNKSQHNWWCSAGRPGSSEVPRDTLTRWGVSSTPANGIFLTKKLKTKIKMPNRWRMIKSLVHKIWLHGRRGKGMAESFSREKWRHAPQKEGGWEILCGLAPVWPRLVRPTNLMSRMNGKKTHTQIMYTSAPYSSICPLMVYLFIDYLGGIDLFVHVRNVRHFRGLRPSDYVNAAYKRRIASFTCECWLATLTCKWWIASFTFSSSNYVSLRSSQIWIICTCE